MGHILDTRIGRVWTLQSDGPLILPQIFPRCTAISKFIHFPEPNLYWCCCLVVVGSDSFVTLWTVANQVPLSMEFSRQEYQSGLSFLLQGIFPTQGSNPRLLQCWQVLYHWANSEALYLLATPLIAACQASLSINSRSSLKLMSIESVMPSSHLILCRPLLLLLPIPPSIRVFSNESTLRMRWPKYWSFSFSIIPSKEHPGLISFRMDWLDLLAVQGTLKSLLQHHSSKA